MRRPILVAITFFIGVAGAMGADDRNACEGQAVGAIPACTRLISSGKLAVADQATIYLLRGTAYRHGQKYDQAIADLSRAIELTAKNGSPEVAASIYVVRAGIYSQKGDLEKALADYRAAVTLNSKNELAADGIKRAETALLSPAPPNATNQNQAEQLSDATSPAVTTQRNKSRPPKTLSQTRCFTFNGERFCD